VVAASPTWVCSTLTGEGLDAVLSRGFGVVDVSNSPRSRRPRAEFFTTSTRNLLSTLEGTGVEALRSRFPAQSWRTEALPDSPYPPRRRSSGNRLIQKCWIPDSIVSRDAESSSRFITRLADDGH